MRSQGEDGEAELGGTGLGLREGRAGRESNVGRGERERWGERTEPR